MVSTGERLHDFSILVGNEFTSGTCTGAAKIGSWPECAHISGKLLKIYKVTQMLINVNVVIITFVTKM